MSIADFCDLRRAVACKNDVLPLTETVFDRLKSTKAKRCCQKRGAVIQFAIYKISFIGIVLCHKTLSINSASADL